jgi:pSer/pThr/pTyr-binding forkhead associated (FHA) protein
LLVGFVGQTFFELFLFTPALVVHLTDYIPASWRRIWLMDVHMLVVQGKARGQYLRFPRGEFVFGRGPECHVRPNSDWVSRQHCLLRVTKEGASIRDLGSTNGTLINGARVVGERRLDSGDQLQVGPLVLQVVFREGETTNPPAVPQLLPSDTVVVGQDDTSDIEVPPK